MTGRLADMATLAEMIRGRDLAWLAEIVQREDRIMSEVVRLRKAASREVPGPADIAGADRLWRQWRSERLAALNLDLARLRADRDEAFRAATRAHGRAEVLRRLALAGGSRR